MSCIRRQAKCLAPATFGGYQDQFTPDTPPLELWTLTEAIEGHPVGSTLTRQTLEAKGYSVPAPPRPR